MEASNGTAQTWRERIASQQASGQSIRAWCSRNNCHEHGFYWWRARLGLSPRSNAQRRRRRHGDLAKFTEVIVDQRRFEPLRLSLVGGRELCLPAAMPVRQIAQLIRALETAA